MTKHLYGLSGQEEVEALKSIAIDEAKKVNDLIDKGTCPSCESSNVINDTSYFECISCGYTATN